VNWRGGLPSRRDLIAVVRFFFERLQNEIVEPSGKIGPDPSWSGHRLMEDGAGNRRARPTGVALKLLANRLPGTTDLQVRAVPDWRGSQPLGN